MTDTDSNKPEPDSQEPASGAKAEAAEAKANPDGDQSGFAHATDDFGLTPRPRVKAQRVDPLVGMDLGGVKIVKLIGEGGMGRVYEARQDKPARSVAVKIIRQGITSEKTMRRFEREAEFLGRLQHPGIAQIFIVGTYSSDFGEVPFYVMEHVANAKPITNYVHEQGLQLHDRVRLFKQVCEAVSHGHDRSIVHRDLKPGNILVDSDGNPKVIDFGVARSTDSDLALESMKTDTGQMIGTVQYMSPEQFGPNPDDLDSRTDVYSLGVVLYELLAGVPPYSVSKRALHEASRVVCEQVPAPLRTLDKSIPRDMSAIVERCLNKSPRHRYHNAGELALELGNFLESRPVKAQPAGILGQGSLSNTVRRLATRRTVLATALGVLAIAGVDYMVGPGVLTGRALWPTTVSLEPSSSWTPTTLTVREGACYRITVTGSCADNSGETFGPDGATHEQAQDRNLLGPLPKRMLVGRIRNSRYTIPVGAGLTFVAPWTGELSFRVNEEPSSGENFTGGLRVTLTEVRTPVLVDAAGRTTIATAVNATKYLLFEPGGIRWRHSNFMSATDEASSPTLINGIAWWPLPDKPNAKGWEEVTKTSCSPLLKTSAFKWAAGTGPDALRPVVINGAVTVEGPKPEVPALKFSHSGGLSEIRCTFAKPSQH